MERREREREREGRRASERAAPRRSDTTIAVRITRGGIGWERIADTRSRWPADAVIYSVHSVKALRYITAHRRTTNRGPRPVQSNPRWRRLARPRDRHIMKTPDSFSVMNTRGARVVAKWSRPQSVDSAPRDRATTKPPGNQPSSWPSAIVQSPTTGSGRSKQLVELGPTIVS